MTDLAITLELLGGVELRGVDADAAGRVLVQPKLVALLAYLAIAGTDGRFQRRDQLVALLWPELDQTHARTALRKAAHAIRASLGAEVLVSRGDEELALAASAVACDATGFRDDVDAGRLARAMERYRGDLMPGFHLTDCADFERWLESERTELRERAGAASLALAQMFEDDSSLTIATRWARRAARFSWDDERTLRRALSLLERAGDRSGALQLYDEFAERLKADFNAEPSPETAALVRQLRS
ncbi:MAG: transcriptional activator protein [Gemmatimonadetes bacterium]|nr:transcriptional activator protein [Gemmatimonadota bacterium]